MPPGFWLTIGVLAHADPPENPSDCSLDLPLGDLLGWLFPGEEIHDGGGEGDRQNAEFDRLPAPQ